MGVNGTSGSRLGTATAEEMKKVAQSLLDPTTGGGSPLNRFEGKLLLGLARVVETVLNNPDNLQAQAAALADLPQIYKDARQASNQGVTSFSLINGILDGAEMATNIGRVISDIFKMRGNGNQTNGQFGVRDSLTPISTIRDVGTLNEAGTVSGQTDGTSGDGQPRLTPLEVIQQFIKFAFGGRLPGSYNSLRQWFSVIDDQATQQRQRLDGTSTSIA